MKRRSDVEKEEIGFRNQLKVGTKIDARFKGFWYAARVIKVNDEKR